MEDIDLTTKSCPKCYRAISSNNRIIKEECGHLKCRLCLISEESSCAECLDIQNDKIFCDEGETLKVQQTHNQNDIRIIENIIITQPNKSAKKCKIKLNKSYLPHIIKELSGYKCTICNKSFKSRNQQYYHVYCNNSEHKPFKCSECKKTFSSSYHLKYHSESHVVGIKYKCPKCSKLFANKITLQRHVKNHEKTKFFECNHCDNKFRDSVSCKNHLNKHNNIYPHSCNNCDKKFLSKSSLTKHLKIHSARPTEKQYKCAHCERTFYQQSSLRVHTLKHIDKNVYNCNICSKVFSDHKTLIRHQNLHKSIRYQCGLCDVKSARKDNLARHIRNMHPNENQNQIVQILDEPNKVTHTISLNEKTQHDIISKNDVEVNSDNIKWDSEQTKNNVSNDVAQFGSVIRSVGNVEPLNIPNYYPVTKIISVTRSSTGEVDDNLKNNHHNTPSTFTSKKIKKKYDPCEIYRKILFASNDEDSSLEIEDSQAVSSKYDDYMRQTETSSHTIKIPDNHEDSENYTYSNFNETHWQKHCSNRYKEY